MPAVTTSLPCGYSGILCEATIAHDSSNDFTLTDLGRWETYAEGLSGESVTGIADVKIIVGQDDMRFFWSGGTSDARTNTSAAVRAAMNDESPGLGTFLRVEIADGSEVYDYVGTAWATAAHWSFDEDTSGNDITKHSTATAADYFDEARQAIIDHGATFRIVRK